MHPVGSRKIPAEMTLGTPEHAAHQTEGRHPGVRDALQWLCFSHLPESLRRFSQPFYVAAMDLVQEISDSPELTTALNKLIEAKDSAVRAGIKSDTGRAGPVPRPQTVVDPPMLGQQSGALHSRADRLVSDGRGGTVVRPASHSSAGPVTELPETRNPQV